MEYFNGAGFGVNFQRIKKGVNMNEWKERRLWYRSGANFVVEVSLHTVEQSEFDLGRLGEYRWCVYAYIYPTHPHFAKFDAEGMFQPAANDMPLHGGPCYFQQLRGGDGPEVTAIKVGCDYNHIYDERYSFMPNKEAAGSVFMDADELFRWLENYGQIEASTSSRAWEEGK
jgi:hypothetical protein